MLKGTLVMIIREEEALLFRFSHKGLSGLQSTLSCTLKMKSFKIEMSCFSFFCFVFKILSMFTLKMSCLFFVTEKLKHISYTFVFVSIKKLSRITHILNHPSCKLKMLLLSREITWRTPICKSRLGSKLVSSTG